MCTPLYPTMNCCTRVSLEILIVMGGQRPQLFGFTRYLFTISHTADLCSSWSSFVVIVVVIVILMDNTIPSSDEKCQTRPDFNQVFTALRFEFGYNKSMILDWGFSAGWLAD